MHVSLTPELEEIVRKKVATGLYNNASEVVREALRFMELNTGLMDEVRLSFLRAKLLEGERDIAEGRFTEMGAAEVPAFLQKIRDRVASEGA